MRRGKAEEDVTPSQKFFIAPGDSLDLGLIIYDPLLAAPGVTPWEDLGARLPLDGATITVRIRAAGSATVALELSTADEQEVELLDQDLEGETIGEATAHVTPAQTTALGPGNWHVYSRVVDADGRVSTAATALIVIKAEQDL